MRCPNCGYEKERKLKNFWPNVWFVAEFAIWTTIAAVSIVAIALFLGLRFL